MTIYFMAPNGYDEECLWKETDSPHRPLQVLRASQVDPVVWEALNRWTMGPDLEGITDALIEPVRSAHDPGCPVKLGWGKLRDCNCWKRDIAREYAKRVIEVLS